MVKHPTYKYSSFVTASTTGMSQPLWEDNHTAFKAMESFRVVNSGTPIIKPPLCVLMHFIYQIMILICHLHSYRQVFFFCFVF